MTTAPAAVKARPILFSGPMVRALLAGTKTQTRRLVKPQPTAATWAQAGANLGGNVTQARPVVHPLFGLGLRRDGGDHAGIGFPEPNIRCPYGEAGERLWVRETWAPRSRLTMAKIQRPFYRATDGDGDMRCPWKWRPSIHMPRWAARIVLELTEVRVERLQDITEGDALAEGIRWTVSGPLHAHIGLSHVDGADCNFATARDAYRALWEDINGKGTWIANPWVWCLTFKRVPA